MAVTRKTQKDLDKFHAKFLGPFDLKETFIIGTGVILSYIAYSIVSSRGLTLEDAMPVIAIIMGIAVYLAKAKPNGMPAPQYLMAYYKNNIKCPKVRKYKSYGYFDDIIKKEELSSKKKPYKYKRDKDNPRYL